MAPRDCTVDAKPDRVAILRGGVFTQSESMRIVSWNVENLAPWLADRAGLDAQLDAMGSPDILCLQEIRVRPRDHDQIDAMRELLPGYDCAFALADDPRNASYRGGRAYGVVTYVRNTLGPVTAHVPPWDREGRVVVALLPETELSVVNIYAVNGTSRPYYAANGSVDGDRHAYKRRFQDQLFELATGGRIVIAGDWNVSRSAIDTVPRLRTQEPHATARAQLNAHLERTGYVDAYRHRHPDGRAYSWFARSRSGRLDAARVDYIVVSPDLVSHLRDASILDEPELRPRSDHAPIAIDLAL